jgi:cyclophilin family peptidyl-prolyl cis-trans isomerase
MVKRSLPGLLALCLVLSAQAGTYVQFRTVFGDIGVEMMDKDKPATVQNFLRYQTNGYFRNVFLHRCVPNFVVQGGEFITLNRSNTNLFQPSDLFSWPNFPAVTNEFSVGPRISNSYGTIAMARVGGEVNSATSQWFFNLSDNPELDLIDGGFTVFGRVVHGTNVLNIFNSLSLGTGMVDMRTWFPESAFGDLLKELPVRFAGYFHPFINELIYVDITLLRVEISQEPSGTRVIRWDSVENRTNTVQYTDTSPPEWKTLISTNGNGNRFEIVDPTSSSPFRFYRVKVD